MTYQSKSQAKRIEVMKNAEQSDYEKLYRKLDGLWHDSYKAPGYKALRAVVELHKPYQHEIVSYVFCRGCTIDLDLAPPYPCETIQAIEKEIGDVRL